MIRRRAVSRTTLYVVTALLLTLVAAGCGSSDPGPSNAEGLASPSATAPAPASTPSEVHYENTQYKFSLTYPSGLLEERSPAEIGQMPEGVTCVCSFRTPGVSNSPLALDVAVAGPPTAESLHLTKAQLEKGARLWMEGAQRVAPPTWSHFRSKATRLGGVPAAYMEYRVTDGAKMCLYHVYRIDAVIQLQVRYTTGAGGTEPEAKRVIDSFRLL